MHKGSVTQEPVRAPSGFEAESGSIDCPSPNNTAVLSCCLLLLLLLHVLLRQAAAAARRIAEEVEGVLAHLEATGGNQVTRSKVGAWPAGNACFNGVHWIWQSVGCDAGCTYNYWNLGCLGYDGCQGQTAVLNSCLSPSLPVLTVLQVLDSEHLVHCCCCCWAACPSCLQVLKIERVQNARLWKRYCLKRAELLEAHGQAGGHTAAAGLTAVPASEQKLGLKQELRSAEQMTNGRSKLILLLY